MSTPKGVENKAGDFCEVGRHGGDAVEASTLRQYKSHRDNHILPRIGDKVLAKFTPPDAIAFRDKLITDLSRAQAKKVLTSVKSLFSECASRGHRNQNPFADVGIRHSKRHRHTVVIPDRSEVRAILLKADELAAQQNKQFSKAWRRYRAMHYTFAFAGVRPSELRGLFKHHARIDANLIKVEQRADENNEIGPPKSAAGYREIPVPDQLCEVIEDWLRHCPKGDLLFPNWQGNVENLSNIHRRGWRPLLKQCKLPLTYTPKSLRHFKASELIAGGGDPKEVQEKMGHSTIQVTYDIYGHLFPEDETSRIARVQAGADSLLQQ